MGFFFEKPFPPPFLKKIQLKAKKRKKKTFFLGRFPKRNKKKVKAPKMPPVKKKTKNQSQNFF